MRRYRFLPILIQLACIVAGGSLLGCRGSSPGGGEGAPANPEAYANFEAPQTHPLRLSPDGSRLFAVNTDAGRLSVFALDDPRRPVRIAEVPVGLAPVSVWPRSNDEAWVVNHLSDSVAVVSVSRGIVTATLPAGDEPSDIVMTGAPPVAFVSASRSRELRVLDPQTLSPLASIPLEGEHPRALAVSPDGSRVYVAFALSGNGTTIVPPWVDPAPPPEPAVPGLPAAPPVGRIVDADDPDWSHAIPFTLLDHDVAEVDVASRSLLRYFEAVGSVNLGLAVRPGGDELYVTNTDARNRVFFETSLRGHLVENRLSRVTLAGAEVAHYDLHPGVDHGVLPNPAALATSLAQPADLVFDPSGEFAWVAAFGSDRIARVGSDGVVQAIIEVGSSSGAAIDSARKRGPRGLALSADGRLLYVQNRLSNTLAVVDTAAASVVAEVALGSWDPVPGFIRQGRGFFYDAKRSGSGNASCASCHVDGDTDNLAWNLGNPEGEMLEVLDPATGSVQQLHPMKGPLVTQPLAGIGHKAPFHWRGDMPTLDAFNRTFDRLMGGSQLPAADMRTVSDFMASISPHPNPHLRLDRSYADTVNGLSPLEGLADFQALVPSRGPVPCTGCHTLPGEPFRVRIVIPPTGNMAKVPEPVLAYRKAGYQRTAGARNTLGFGLTQDGSGALDTASPLTAFLLSWDTGTAPAVGHMFTVNADTASLPRLASAWITLETRSAAGDNGIAVNGELGGRRHSLLYQVRDGRYHSCGGGGATYSRQQLLSAAQAGEAVLTVLGLPPESWGCTQGQAWP